MNKKGFTLVEIIGVITLIAVISLVAMPPIINQINKKKDEMTSSLEQQVYAGANLYVNDNASLMKYTTCVKLSTLVSGEYLDSSIYSYVKTDDRFNENGYVKIVNDKQNDDGSNHYTYELTDTCVTSKSLYETVLDNDPLLELGDSGCKYSDSTENYSYMGGCYFTDYVSLNYLNYNNRLWRIMGINADKSIRIITSEAASTEQLAYAKSDDIKTWLEGTYYKKLSNTDIIVDGTWCLDELDFEYVYKSCDNVITSKISTLTSNEFILSNGAKYATGISPSYTYLTNGQDYWTLNKSNNIYVNDSGTIQVIGPNTNYIRPVININGATVVKKVVVLHLIHLY